METITSVVSTLVWVLFKYARLVRIVLSSAILMCVAHSYHIENVDRATYVQHELAAQTQTYSLMIYNVYNTAI